MKRDFFCRLAAFAHPKSQKLHCGYLDSPMFASSEHAIEGCWLHQLEHAGLASKSRRHLQFNATGN